MKRIYLVGDITEDPRTHQWRKDAIKPLSDFEVDDPASTKFDKTLLKESGGDKEKFWQGIAEQETEILLPKSYQSVERADIILVNFEFEALGHVGHLFEVAWAWQLHKTIIAVRGTGPTAKHPMVRKAVHAFADNLEEACEIIKTFFRKRK